MAWPCSHRFHELCLLAQDLTKVKPGEDPIIDWGDALQVTPLTQELWVVESDGSSPFLEGVGWLVSLFPMDGHIHVYSCATVIRLSGLSKGKRNQPKSQEVEVLGGDWEKQK